MVSVMTSSIISPISLFRSGDITSYLDVSTFGFGEKIRAASHHCEENKKFFQINVSIDNGYNFDELWDRYNQTENMDDYGNIIFDYTQLSNDTYEIYCDYKYAKTRQGWKEWILKNLIQEEDDFEIEFLVDHEVRAIQEKEPPFTQGTIYANSRNSVRALGQFLYVAYREDPKKNWKINVYDYEDKIKFAQQSETLLSSVNDIGVILLGSLFILFLSTNMMINIRNKTTEIAIFRAMGGSLLSILFVFNTQVLILVAVAAIFALFFIYCVAPYAKIIFIKNVIEVIWKNIDDQREAVIAITDNNFFLSILQLNYTVIAASCVCVIIVVSLMIIRVRFSPKFAITKILKER